MCPSLAMRSISASQYQPSRLRDGDEVLVHVRHQHARLVAHERHGEQRLEPRRAARDDRDRAGRRHGGDVAVAQQLHRADALARRRRARRSRRGPRSTAPTPGTAPRCSASRSALPLGLVVHELHHLPAQLHALGAVVGDAQPHEHVGEPHHAEPDAADALGQRVDLRQRVLVGVDDVVEEVRAQMDVGAERVPVHLARPARSSPRLTDPRLQTS